MHSLCKPLGHQHLDTTQQYACIYDETLYEQFKIVMSCLEAIAVDDWQGVDVSEPALAEIGTGGPAWRLNVANSVRFGKVSPPQCYGVRRITCQVRCC
jgi:hypothetical protein